MLAECGVRIAEGAHRADVTDFIRDAHAGGSASGTPPTNLGFRLVRESKTVLARVASVFRKPDFGGLAGARSSRREPRTSIVAERRSCYGGGDDEATSVAKPGNCGETSRRICFFLHVSPSASLPR